MAYSLDQLSSMMDALTARVNALDGENLAEPATAEIYKLKQQVAGVKTTINQATLALESSIQLLITKLNNLTLQVQQHLS